MNCETENRRTEKKIIYYREIRKMYIDSFWKKNTNGMIAEDKSKNERE